MGKPPEGVDALATSLAGDDREVELIGDALTPRRIIDATLEGARAGQRV